MSASGPKVVAKARHRLSEEGWFVLFVAPTVLVLLVIIFIPLGRAVYLSMTDYNLVRAASGQTHWVGLANFGRLLSPGSPFWEAFANTLVYTFVTVLTCLILGFIGAVVLNQTIPFLHLFRALMLVPWIMPTVVTALLWLWILNPQYGILNFFLSGLALIRKPVPWLANPSTAMLMIILMTVWKALPYYTLMLLAGLQIVPVELLEAAMLDGANAAQRFWYVTIPAVRNIILVVTLMGTIWGFQQFTLIWTTTKGGPVRVTETLPIFIYREAFQAHDMGYAAAAGLIGLLFLTVFALLYVRWMWTSD